MHTASAVAGLEPLDANEQSAIAGGSFPNPLPFLKGVGIIGVANWIVDHWTEIESGYASVSSDVL